MLTDIVNCQAVTAHLAYVYQSDLYELLHCAWAAAIGEVLMCSREPTNVESSHQII